MTQDLLTEGIPYKGAMSIGMMTCDIDKSIYFGQPLIDAYYLQEELYFYGVVLHGSVEKEIEERSTSIFTMEYDCPFKKGKSKHKTITPMYMAIDTGTEQEKEERNKTKKTLLKSVKDMRFSTSGNLRIYLDSTIKYLDHVQTKALK